MTIVGGNLTQSVQLQTLSPVGGVNLSSSVQRQEPVQNIPSVGVTNNGSNQIVITTSPQQSTQIQMGVQVNNNQQGYVQQVPTNSPSYNTNRIVIATSPQQSTQIQMGVQVNNNQQGYVQQVPTNTPSYNTNPPSYNTNPPSYNTNPPSYNYGVQVNNQQGYVQQIPTNPPSYNYGVQQVNVGYNTNYGNQQGYVQTGYQQNY